MQAEQVKQILIDHLPGCDVEVAGEGSNFDLTIIGDVFEGLSAVKQQQLVYGGLNQYIADGDMHAVNMKIYTRSQWQQLNG